MLWFVRVARQLYMGKQPEVNLPVLFPLVPTGPAQDKHRLNRVVFRKLFIYYVEIICLAREIHRNQEIEVTRSQLMDTHACTYTCMHITHTQCYTHMHAHCTYTHTHTHACTYAHIHTHACTYMHTHTHAHTNMYTHTHTCKLLRAASISVTVSSVVV